MKVPFVYNTICSQKHIKFAGIAQLVEQLIRNEQVACSSHVSSSMKRQISTEICRFSFIRLASSDIDFVSDICLRK